MVRLGRALLPMCLLASACGHADDKPASADDDIKSGVATSPAPPRTQCTPPKTFTARAWPEADALFHQDPRWLGADAAYSIALAPGRILWLFGDTFIAKTEAHTRAASTFIRNSVAIQSGTDPTTSTITFSWQVENGVASSFFPEVGDHWLWPLHGARIGNELVLFMTEIARADGGLGFQTLGTRLVRIANPDADPSAWTVSSRVLPSDERSHGTSVVVVGDSLYALSTRPTFFFDIELERWPIAALDGKSMFWDGSGFGAPARSKPIWKAGAPEFVTAAHCNEWLTVESTGFGATDLAVRRAKALAGPWSDPVKVFHPPDSDRPNALVYAGKFHPELSGADLVATYAANSTDFATVVHDATLYYPRFVQITEKR